MQVGNPILAVGTISVPASRARFFFPAHLVSSPPFPPHTYVSDMSPLETLGFALGTSFASGLNVYATVAAAGLFERFGIIQLPDSLQVLANPFVLGIALTLFVVEFIADK